MRFSSSQVLDSTSPSPQRTALKCAASTGDRDDQINRWVSQIHAEMQAENCGQTAPPANTSNQLAEAARAQLDHRTAATVDVTLEFGRARLHPAATALAPGAVVKLDQRANEPIDILVAGRTIARGELLVSDGKLGIKILERFDHVPAAHGAHYD